MTLSGRVVAAASLLGRKLDVLLARIVRSGDSSSNWPNSFGLGVYILVDRLNDEIGVPGHFAQVGTHPHTVRHRTPLAASVTLPRSLQAFKAVADHPPRPIETLFGTGMEPHVVARKGELDGNAVSHETRADHSDAADVLRVQ